MEYKTLKELDLQPGDVVGHMGSGIITYIVDHPENHPNHPCPIHKEKGLVAIGYDGIKPVWSFQSVDSSCNKSWYLISRKEEEEVEEFNIGDVVYSSLYNDGPMLVVGNDGDLVLVSYTGERYPEHSTEGSLYANKSELTHVEYEEVSHSATPEETLPEFAKVLYEDSSVVVYRKVKEPKVVVKGSTRYVDPQGEVRLLDCCSGKFKITVTMTDGVLTAEIV